MKPDILLTFKRSAQALYYGEPALSGLRALGEVRLNDSDSALEGEALIAAAQGCQVIVSDRQTPGPGELFARCPQLAVFQRCAIDIRNIDVAAASQAGVLVTQASAGFTTAVAEWVLGVMIDLSRGISDSVLAYRSGAAPAVAMGRELHGATLGVVGYGQIGRRVCTLGLALGMHVIVADPQAKVADAAIGQVDLDTLLARADIVVCLAAALPQTENLMDGTAFARMRRGAYFINAARGNLVDEDALLQALDSGHLGGCALDVGRAPDQMPSEKLARHPRAIATPHIGGLTPAATAHQALETVAQLAEILRGGVPAGAVNAASARRLGGLHTAAG